MKKYLQRAFLLSLVLCLLLSFAACKDGNENPGGDDSEPAGEFVIADFEQWGPDFQLIRLSSYFGRVTRNRDPQFIKSGTYSAKIEALGGYSTKYEPIMQIPLVSGLFEFDYSDFRWYDYISCSVYSEAEGNVIKIGLMAGDGINSFGGTKVLEKKYVLSQGWNELKYDINASLIALTQDPQFINGISFSFENAASRDLEDAYVMYLDDIKMCRREEIAVVEDLIDLRPYEICDFEQLWQQYLVSWSGNSLITPEMTVVGAQTTESGKPVSPTSGSSMLHVHLKAGQAEQGSLNYINIPMSIMQEAFRNITDAEIENGYLRFDVYNDGSAPTIFYPQFYNADGQLICAYDFTSLTDQWVTFKVKLSELRERGVLPADKIGTMTVPYWEFTGEDRDFYFDNFRITV